MTLPSWVFKGTVMAGKPNYRFERLQRERTKAAKKAARLEAKKAKKRQDDEGLVLDPGDNHETSQDDEQLPTD